MTPAVTQEAGTYFGWAGCPACRFCRLWDGIPIGATATRLMLYSMSGPRFLLDPSPLFGMMGTMRCDAFLIYLLPRGSVQWVLWNRHNELGNRSYAHCKGLFNIELDIL